MVWGPRQVGKTTLLDQLDLNSRLFLDDLGARQSAQNDPAFVISTLKLPCLIDEAQYAPNLFPEIKRLIDQQRREGLKVGSKPATQFYFTGSNRTLLDKTVKESLAGRCHLFTLHGLSIKELQRDFNHLNIGDYFVNGGFPELYTRENLNPRHYINDYITSFVEKDIAVSAGIEKMESFHKAIRLLAARTGQFLNISELSKLAGVDQKTLDSWLTLLQRNSVIELLPTFATNLSKRIVKMKKLFFYDVGLCSRLQGFVEPDSIIHSPQAGALFETLVFSEIVKTRDNFLKEWQLHTWRTKEKNEIDFILTTPNQTFFIEAKMGVNSISDFKVDPEAKKVFRQNVKKIIVSAGGEIQKISTDSIGVPLKDLGDYLLKES